MAKREHEYFRLSRSATRMRRFELGTDTTPACRTALAQPGRLPHLRSPLSRLTADDQEAPMSQLVPVPVVDRSAMRPAMACWITGVAVITTVNRNGRATANYSHHQLPAVPGALAHLDRHIDAGDHVIVFGAVQRAWHRDGEPLAFLSGRFGDYTDRRSRTRSTGSSEPTLGWRAAHQWSRRELNRHARS
jgi:hypothetical protein